MDKVAWISLAWALLSGLVNIALRAKTPEAWEAFVVRSPKGAAAVKLLRAAGFDPPGMIRHLQALLARKAAP